MNSKVLTLYLSFRFRVVSFGGSCSERCFSLVDEFRSIGFVPTAGVSVALD